MAKPFDKEEELAEKSERLAELHVLLNMDEKAPSEALGAEEVTEAADQPRSKVNYAGRVAEEAVVADSPRRPSVLEKLENAKTRIAEQRGSHPSAVRKQAVEL